MIDHQGVLILQFVNGKNTEICPGCATTATLCQNAKPILIGGKTPLENFFLTKSKL